jgi:signal recognition particle subunit SRP54
MLERFGEAQKMMKKMAAGGGMPGMPGGRGGAKKGKASNKKKQKFGNPAKAAQAELDAQNRKSGTPSAPTGASFGQQGNQDFDPANLNLPKGFEKFLGK